MFCLVRVIMLSVSVSASVFSGFEFAVTNIYTGFGSRRSLTCTVYGEKHAVAFVRKRNEWKLATITCDHRGNKDERQPTRLAVSTQVAYSCKELLQHVEPTSDITKYVTRWCKPDISVVKKKIRKIFLAPTANVADPAASVALSNHQQTPAPSRSWRVSGETVVGLKVSDICTISSTKFSMQIHFNGNNLTGKMTCANSMDAPTKTIYSVNHKRFLYSDGQPKHSTNSRLLKCDVLAAAMDVELICSTYQQFSQRAVLTYRKQLRRWILVFSILFTYLTYLVIFNSLKSFF
jgi:hypothetical protein